MDHEWRCISQSEKGNMSIAILVSEMYFSKKTDNDNYREKGGKLPSY